MPTPKQPKRSTSEPKEPDQPSLPSLKTYLTTTQTDQITSLRLIADSIAQQRQTAAKRLITHPLTISLTLVPLAIIYQLLYKNRSDLPLIGTTWAGCIMGVLLVIRYLTAGYIEKAEKTGTWKWLRGTAVMVNGKEEKIDESMVVVTKFGNEVIGTVVFGSVASELEEKETGVIRAWTVKQRYRRKGVGKGLLEVVGEISRERGWEGVVFDERHANADASNSRVFEGEERRAKGALGDVLLR